MPLQKSHWNCWMFTFVILILFHLWFFRYLLFLNIISLLIEWVWIFCSNHHLLPYSVGWSGIFWRNTSSCDLKAKVMFWASWLGSIVLKYFGSLLKSFGAMKPKEFCLIFLITFRWLFFFESATYFSQRLVTPNLRFSARNWDLECYVFQPKTGPLEPTYFSQKLGPRMLRFSAKDWDRRSYVFKPKIGPVQATFFSQLCSKKRLRKRLRISD